MPMSSQRLGLLVRVSDSNTETAARDLGRQQVALDEQRRRLQELRGYLHEYGTQPLPSTPALIANRERFLARLSAAELQQVRAVTQAETSVQQSTERWIERRRTGEKFETLQTGAIQRETRVIERRSQQGLDEFALRDFALRRSAFSE